MAKIEDLIHISMQSNEILKRVENSSLEAINVRKALDDILERKSTNLEPPSCPGLAITNLFVSLTEQLSNLQRWNDERNWGFVESDFKAVDLTPRASYDNLTVDVIAVYLPSKNKASGVQRTFMELWIVALSANITSPLEGLINPSSDNLRLLVGIEHKPGVRRVTVDLGAYSRLVNSNCPAMVRNSSSAHAEILAAAAHFPEWIKAMGQSKVPCVWLSGYQTRNNALSSWSDVPILTLRGEALHLSSSWEGFRQPELASPVIH